MNGKNIGFSNEKIKKATSTTKTKKIFNIHNVDVDKILISKKETYGEYNSLNILLGIMIMVLLDHYNYFFHKQPAISINLIKIK